jgi:hypothetical protein
VTSGKWRVTSSSLTTHHSPRITPFGEPSTGEADEQLIPDDPDERIVYARRIVAQRCLYGVDINPLAVEMAKLSLWLLTLAKDKPFTFLDHCIRCGDSLVGISSIGQLERFSLNDGGPQKSFAHEQIRRRIEAARLLRLQLERMPTNSVEDIERKTEMLKRADEQTGRLRYAADMMLATHWIPMSDTAREQELQDTLMDVEFKFKDLPVEVLDREANTRLTAIGCSRAFHWAIQFPEVFAEESGFDAFVGNPPFQNGYRLGRLFGPTYVAHIDRYVAHGTKGSADLCSYFLLRSLPLIRLGSACGFLATKTISQGDTRKVGLQAMVARGITIIRAIPDRLWPRTASVRYATIWFTRSDWKGKAELNGVEVSGITSALEAADYLLGEPERLQSNESRAFKGTTVGGEGFILEPAEAMTLLAQREDNCNVILPYLIGKDVTSNLGQVASRWIINFHDWDIEMAQEYRECFDIVVDRVKPYRDQLTGQVHEEDFWKFQDKRLESYDDIRALDSVLVVAMTSKLLAPVLVPKHQVFDQQLVVFKSDRLDLFAVLSSSIHYWWVLQFTTPTAAKTPRYLLRRCFETFAFPTGVWGDVVDSADNRVLRSIGSRFNAARAEFMQRSELGLTDAYNRLDDKKAKSNDIDELRELIVELDQAVAAAYGWHDLDLGHDFHETKQGVRYTISEPARLEVLRRLLKLNHERYEEEVKQGLHAKKGREKSGEGRARKKAKAGRKEKSTGQASLFPTEEESGEG